MFFRTLEELVCICQRLVWFCLRRQLVETVSLTTEYSFLLHRTNQPTNPLPRTTRTKNDICLRMYKYPLSPKFTMYIPAPQATEVMLAFKGGPREVEVSVRDVGYLFRDSAVKTALSKRQAEQPAPIPGPPYAPVPGPPYAPVYAPPYGDTAPPYGPGALPYGTAPPPPAAVPGPYMPQMMQAQGPAQAAYGQDARPQPYQPRDFRFDHIRRVLCFGSLALPLSVVIQLFKHACFFFPLEMCQGGPPGRWSGAQPQPQPPPWWPRGLPRQPRQGAGKGKGRRPAVPRPSVMGNF